LVGKIIEYFKSVSNLVWIYSKTYILSLIIKPIMH